MDSILQSLDQEDPLEEGMATLSSILAWRVPWTEEPGGLQHIVLQCQTQLKWLSMHLCTYMYICVCVCVYMFVFLTILLQLLHSGHWRVFNLIRKVFVSVVIVSFNCLAALKEKLSSRTKCHALFTN